MTTVVELCVFMDCPGCESKVRRALANLQGVNDVNIDMAKQKVTVTGWVDQKKVLKAVRKAGRWAILWPGGNVPAHQLILDARPRSYNYYVHGYDNVNAGPHGYYYPPENSNVDGKRSTCCSVM